MRSTLQVWNFALESGNLSVIDTFVKSRISHKATKSQRKIIIIFSGSFFVSLRGSTEQFGPERLDVSSPTRLTAEGLAEVLRVKIRLLRRSS